MYQRGKNPNKGDREQAGLKISEALKNSEAMKTQKEKTLEAGKTSLINFLEVNNSHISLTGEYSGAIVKTDFLCNRHNIPFAARPNDIKNGAKGCAECTKESRSKNNAMKRPDIVKKARETSIQKYGTNVGEYFKSKSIEARVLSSVNHLEDTRKQQYFDREWMDNFYTNQMNNINQVAAYFDVKRDVIIGQLTRLDIGIINHKTSQAETEIATFISNLGFEVFQNDRSVISPKEIDIYIPSLNIGIEYHGCYWHSEDTGHDNGRHLEKLSSCSSKGIRLIQIWEDDYINRKDVVLKFLLNVLGLNTSKVNARETKVVSLDQAAYSQFLDQWHMQGSHQTASIRIGLMIQDELVSVMGFKPKPSNVNKYGPGVGYELVRFASIGARGAFSKLLKWFERQYNPNFIYSFADLEIVNDINNVYIKQGFEYHSSLNPDYSYYNKTTGMREHKFNWRKQKFQSLGLDIEGKTEQQLSVEYGLRRCWDSGKVCYIKRKSLH